MKRRATVATDTTPIKPPARKRVVASVTSTEAPPPAVDATPPITVGAPRHKWLEIAEAQNLTVETLLARKCTGAKTDYKAKLEQAMRLLPPLRECIRYHQAELIRATAAVDGLQAKHAAALASTMAERDQLRGERTIMHEERDALARAIANAQRSELALKTRCKDLEVAQMQLEATVRAQEEEMKSLRSEKDTLVSRVNVTEAAMEQSKEHARCLQETNWRFEERETNLNERYRQASEERAALQKEAAQLAARVAALDEATVEMKHQTKEMKALVKEFRQRAHAAEASERQTTVRATKAESGLEELRGRLARMDHELTSAATKAEKEVHVMQDRLLSQEASHRATMETIVKDKDVMFARLKDKLQEDLRSSKAATSEVEARLLDLEQTSQTTIAALRGELAEAQERTQAFERTLLKARTDAAASMKTAHELQTERDRLTVDVNSARAELERWQDMYRGIEQQLDALRKKRAELVSSKGNQEKVIESLKLEVETLTKQNMVNEERAAQLKDATLGAQATIGDYGARLEDMRRQLQKSEMLRKSLHNTVQDLRGNVRVYCRVRPTEDPTPSVHYFEDTDRKATALQLKYTRNQREQTHQFNFDRVFRPSASQAHVFDDISQLVQSALDGYNVCVFAYGQTGSGKTHTMMGHATDPGMIPRAMAQVFTTAEELRAHGWQYQMRVSFLEIYNEEYRDLLSPNSSVKIEVQHDEFDKTTSLTNCTVAPVANQDEVTSLMARAMKERSVAETNMNEQSSRSHCVFILCMEGKNEELGQVIQSSLNMIDLAGSERLKSSGVEGERRDEAVSINASLSAIKTCFQQMLERQCGARAFVNYRSSKLTWLLKPALEGEAKTLMFVNVDPSTMSASETKSTMQFAARVNVTATAAPGTKNPLNKSQSLGVGPTTTITRPGGRPVSASVSASNPTTRPNSAARRPGSAYTRPPGTGIGRHGGWN